MARIADRRGGDLHPAELLAQVLRCAADHQPGQEDRDDREDEDAVQPGADPAGRDLPEQHVEQRDRARAAGVAVVQGVDRAGRGARRRHREEDRRGHAEAHLLALHRGARGERGLPVRVGLGRPATARKAAQITPITADEHHALAAVADHRPERPGEADRDHEQQEDLEEVRERVRVLERVRGVGVEDPPPFVPSSLIASWEPAGASGIVYWRAVHVGHVEAGLQRHHDTARDQQDRRDERERQQDADRAAGEVDPEVAEALGPVAEDAADQRDRDRQPHRRRHTFCTVNPAIWTVSPMTCSGT